VRLAALAESGLVGSPPEEEFDRLTRLAVRLLGARVSLLTLVDDTRQYLMSAAGLPPALAGVRQTPLADSICRLVVSAGGPVVIPDARLDPRVRDAAPVALYGIRSYAGVPLVTAEGLALGSLCVSHTEPRAWTDDDLAALRDLAGVAAAEIERRRAEARSARAQEQLRSADAYFRAVVEQSLAGIYVIQDGRFRYVNPALAAIFQYPVEELVRPGIFMEIVHPDDLPRVEENLRRRLSGEVPTLRYSFRGLRRDGTVLYLEVHGSRAEIDGRPAIVGVGIDVTERVRAEREKEAARAARDRFYAMASHELRTPVSTVMLYNELLLSGVYGEVDDGQREALERSQKSAQHLLDLINDLLDLSKLEAGKMEARLEEVELAELVEGVAGAVRPMAGEQGCALHVAVPERPLPITGDARRIRQILLNLLTNALKYGRGRPVDVRAGRADGGVEVEVRDHGPGIQPEDLPRIFEDFVQLGDEPGPGTGLGLPIARRLATLMGGTLDVASTPGEGSAFRLFLPADQS
jgi:PAS domain S-box-containing protein